MFVWKIGVTIVYVIAIKFYLVFYQIDLLGTYINAFFFLHMIIIFLILALFKSTQSN